MTNAAVVVAYVGIGIAAFWPVYPGISQRLFSTNGPDFVQALWYLDWAPHALAHGLNPFFSNAMLAPTGVNLAQNNSTPLLGLLTVPLAPIAGPVVRANLLLLLSMPISATAAFVVLRKWKVWTPAAALGGLVYGFSPFMIAQSDLGHLCFVFAPLPPFIALTVASILQRRGPSRRLGVHLGCLIVVQYLINPEVLAITAIMVVAAIACIAVRNKANVPTMMREASAAAGVALAIGCVLLAYPIWMSFFGPQHFTGSPFPATNPYHTDLLGTIVPTQSQRVSLGMGSLASHVGDVSEASGFIGLPVLLLSAFLALRSRRSQRVQLAAVLLLLAVVVSLGPHLAIDGHVTAFPLPFLVLDHVPVVNYILPSRVCLAMYACLAALIAFGLDDICRDRSTSPRQRRLGTALCLITLLVLVFTLLPKWPAQQVAQSASALPTAVTRAIPATDPVAITYPYDIGASRTQALSQPMLWQAQDDFRFRLLGGYAWHVGLGGYTSLLPNPMTPGSTQRLLADQEGFSLLGPETLVSPNLVATTRSVLLSYDVHVVIVDRSFAGSGAVMELFQDALGRPELSAGHFSMWVNWRGTPSREDYSDQLRTSVVTPAQGASLAHTVALDALAAPFYTSHPITKVVFLLSGGGLRGKVIAVATPGLIGWAARWDSTGVTNGTYVLQSVAYDSTGSNSPGPGVSVTVENHG